MIKNIILLFFFIISCTETNNQNAFTYEIDINKTEIGYPVNLDISLNNLDEYYSIEEMVWSDSSLWISDSSRVLIKNSSIDTLDHSLSVSFEITFWDTGRVVIPPYFLSINFPDSTESTVFSTEPIEIEIASVIDSTMLNIEKDKPVKEIKFPYERYRIFLISIILFLLACIFHLWRNRSQGNLFNQIQFFNKDPRKDSVKKLNQLKFENISSAIFYDKLSIILKRYLENQYYVISFEMTSEEIKTFFNDADLIAILDKIDSVKFANKEYSNSEKKYDLELTKKIVRKLL
tara:strand:+ start:3907 stop:4776 length:870 start_codon:yes stop_codon:yes gene_type:complete